MKVAAALSSLSVAGACWAVPAEPQRQLAAAGAVTVTLDRTTSFSEHCYAATVFNGTSKIIDAFVRFEFRHGSSRWTSHWFGIPTQVVWGVPGESISRIGAGLYFENLNPGSSKRMGLSAFSATSDDGRDLGALIWDWGKHAGSCEDDFEIRLPTDAVGALRWEVNDVQRAFEKLKDVREQRLKDDAAAIQRLYEPVSAKPSSRPANASSPDKAARRVAQVPDSLNPNASRITAQLDLPGPARRGPGDLLAKADELREGGDSVGSRAKLRELIAAYPDHPLSSQAAEQLIGPSNAAVGRPAPSTAPPKAPKSPCDVDVDDRNRLAQACLAELEAAAQEERLRMGDRYDPNFKDHAFRNQLKYCPSADPAKRRAEWAEFERTQIEVWNAPRGIDYAKCMVAARGLERMDLTGNRVGTSSVSASGCNAAMDRLHGTITATSRRALPAGAVPPLQRVMWATAEAIKTIDAHCVGEPARQNERSNYQRDYRDAEAACKAMTGGACPGPNAF